jgi:proton glutamate symport protein
MTHAPAIPSPRMPSLAHWMLLGTGAGIALGLLAPHVARELNWAADIFVRLLRLLVAPLLFGVLVPAIAKTGRARDLGRLGWRALLLFEIATTLALVVGLLASWLLEPGLDLALAAPAGTAPAPLRLRDVVINALPTNPVDMIVRGDVLQIVVCSVLIGAVTLAAGDRGRPVVTWAEAIAAVTYRCVHYVMWLAPIAVCAALATTIAANGTGTLQGLGRFVLTAWAAELGFLGVVAIALAAAGVPVLRFAVAIREAFLLALATSASAAALPQALAGLARFGVSPQVLGFVAPLSLTLHMNGSVVYMGVAVLFAAQAAGIALSLPTLLLMVLIVKVASKGVTGIPRATPILLAAILEQTGLPTAAVALLLGVDALVDPIRTAVNLTSHCAAPALVGRWTGERYDAPARTAATGFSTPSSPGR